MEKYSYALIMNVIIDDEKSPSFTKDVVHSAIKEWKFIMDKLVFIFNANTVIT